MGPPSRYNVYVAAHARAQQAQDAIQTEAIVDTISLSNADWAKHHLRFFASACTPDEFTSRTDDAFSRSVNITVNGLHLSRELYAQQWGMSFRAQGAITHCSAIETPNVRIPMLRDAALVGIMYDASFTSPAEHLDIASRLNQTTTVTVTSTINLIIAEDKTLPPFCSDRRRIFTVNQVIVDKDGLLTFPLRD